MADDVISSFLVKIAFQQDEKSRQKFDEGLKQVQTRAAEFGAKIGELPTIVSEATKRISASLTELWYASQKTGASAEQIDALRRAAEQSGEGADNAERSWNGFSETLRKFGDAAGRQLKSIFDIEYDPNDKFGAFLQARSKFSKEYNEATDKEGKGRAIARAEALNLGEESAVKGRQDIFTKYFEKQLTRNSGLEAEKAAALTRAYNALADAIETVARKADAALFDKFGAVLDRLTKWLDEDSERIVKFFTDLATQIGLVFTDLAKLSPAFALLWAALKEVGGWLQKIIGQPDAGGLAGVRHLLEFISGVVMARFVASMVAGFALAFGPVTALLTALGALGVIAYTGGWLGGGGAGSGFGAGEGEESGGHGRERRGKFGHGGGGPKGKGGTKANTPAAMAAAEAQLRAEGVPEANVHAAAALLVGQATAESGLDPTAKHDFNPSTGSFGYGVYGASAIRKGPMFAWMAEHGFAKDSLEGQMKYMAHEAMTKYSATKAALMRATESNIDASTRIITPDFEGPKFDNSGARIGFARSALGKTSNRPITSPLSPQDFHKAIETIRNARPLVPWQHSMNEIHDYRSVENINNFHIASASPADMMGGDSLGRRPKNADLIRNTTSYAS